MCRLRQGRANTARGAAHFLRETVGRVRYAGATGQLTVRADSGFYNHALAAAWLAAQKLLRARYGVLAHNPAHRTARISLGEPVITIKTHR